MAERLPRAKRALGQNFLVDGNLQRKIVRALGATTEDTVVEIGPGPGALTRHLVEKVGRLIAIELDDDLVVGLEEEFGDRDHVTLVHQDVLKVDLPGLVEDWSSALVVGNIPYNITTPILFHVLERPRPASILLMVQREVAERIAAAPDTSGYGALSVGVQSVADASILFGVPRRAFRPSPNVDSAIIRITPHSPPRLTERDEVRLRTLTRAAFQWRRKQMQKTLRDHPDIGLPREVVKRMGGERDLTRRPETFSPDELLDISRQIL